jgi:hypothetical protein
VDFLLEATMKYLPFLAIAAFTFGCGSSETAPEKPTAREAGDPGGSEKAEIRAKIDAKKKDLAQADRELAANSSEREAVLKQDASDSKTTKLIELQRQENDTKQKKASLSSDIDDLQAQLSGQPAPSKPAKAGDALDDILASNENKEKEDAERRRKKAEDEAAADKSRIAKAEAARQAEKDEQAKQKIEGGRIAAGPDAPAFEDRWADVIQKVRTELQRYKRW